MRGALHLGGTHVALEVRDRRQVQSHSGEERVGQGIVGDEVEVRVEPARDRARRGVAAAFVRIGGAGGPRAVDGDCAKKRDAASQERRSGETSMLVHGATSACRNMKCRRTAAAAAFVYDRQPDASSATSPTAPLAGL